MFFVFGHTKAALFISEAAVIRNNSLGRVCDKD